MTSELPGGAEGRGGRANAEPDGEWQRDGICRLSLAGRSRTAARC